MAIVVWVGHADGMRRDPDPHYRHRFPAELIAHAVWLYHTFPLSFRDVERLLAERSVEVSYERVRPWCRKFAQTFAIRLRRRRPKPGDHWHLDQVFIRINGVQHDLWRAVDQDGAVLDILVQSRRTTKAAKRFFTKLLKGLLDVPRGVITDGLKSSGAAKAKLIPRGEHSHPPPRLRERRMKRSSHLGKHSSFSPHMAPFTSTPTLADTGWVRPSIVYTAPGLSLSGKRRRVLAPQHKDGHRSAARLFTASLKLM
ncbi:putative transposase [Azospirillum canadense]|nr:putative transposase [Azospirillum canadense]